LSVAIGVFLLGACTTTEIIHSNSTPAKQTQLLTPADLMIDIGILPLDTNIPDSEDEIEKQLIIPDVRRAESQYIAYHLKDTLEQTGNWGAVRVTPQTSAAVDLTVSGKIIQSDGEWLKIRLSAVDSTGRVWVDRLYDDQASKYSYDTVLEDPFQDSYNAFANDLLLYREALNDDNLREVRRVTSLKYAKALAPDSFSGYLEDKAGRTQIVQLPAQDDAMLKRVNLIRDREYLLVDTLDDFYSKFYRDMKPSYDEWRYATYDEALRLREVKKQARNQLLTGTALIAGGLMAGSNSRTYAGQAASVQSVIGGVGVVKVGLDRKREAEIHAQSLKELNQSLGSEIMPHVLDIEGQTIELTGTADAQYARWREILQEIYDREYETR
ncbi:MAG: hypothetical protein AAF525_20825, partial [Pseudomonadota bacterium]